MNILLIIVGIVSVIISVVLLFAILGTYKLSKEWERIFDEFNR